MATVRVFKSDQANTVFVAHGTVGSWPFFCLQAIGNGDGTVSVRNLAKVGLDGDPFYEFASRAFADYVDENDAQHGATEAETVNALNALFNATSAAAAPTITSATTIPASTNVPVNYTLTGVGIAGVEWGSLPSGIAVNSNNRRNIQGTISTPGTYAIDVDAVNAFGTTSQTITIEAVATFANTKSVRFNNADWLGANAARMDATLGRPSNGSGSSDAWSISLWIKPGTSGNQSQTVIYFGSASANSGHFRLIYNGDSVARRQLIFDYGTAFNGLELTTPVGSLTPGQWHHVMVTYDGGTTGASSGSLPAYYSRFAIYIDGVAQTTTNAHTNFGYTGSIFGQNFRLGRYRSSGYLRNNTLLEELAIWTSDQSANIAAIYNGGVTFDLDTLGTPPDHWWRMGDGDTFPTIQEQRNPLDSFAMNNMTVNDIVSDVP